MSGRSAPVLATACAVLLVALLVLTVGNPFATGDLPGEDVPPEPHAGKALGAAPDELDARASGGPTLVGREAAPDTDAPAERGPLEVVVVNHHGLPLADVPVRREHQEAVPMPKAEDAPGGDLKNVSPAMRWAVAEVVHTDGRGMAVFPDVSYDGLERVRAGGPSDELEPRVITGVIPRVRLTDVRADRITVKAGDDKSPPLLPPHSPVGCTPPTLSDLKRLVTTSVRVNEDGMIQLGKQPDAAHSLQPPADFEIDPARPDVVRRITGPRLRLVLPTGLPLDVKAFDASTGTDVEVSARTAHPGFTNGAGQSMHGALVMPEVGRVSTVTVEPELPDRFLALEGWSAEAWISPRAKKLVLHAPVHAEARVFVIPPEEFREPGLKPTGTSVLVDTYEVSTRAEAPDRLGRIEIRGIPHRPNAKLRVTLTYAGKRQVRARGRLAADPRESVELEARRRRRPSVSRALLGGIHPINWRHDKPPPKRASAKHGRVELLIHGPAGVPAPGAVVTLAIPEGASYAARADADGRVAWEQVETGTYDVRVAGAGAAFFTRISVKEGALARRTLRGRAGGRIEVEVLDAAGRPVPFAELSLRPAHGLPYADLDQGAQRIDMRTDVEGQRTFHQVPVGTTLLRFIYEGKAVDAEVDVVEGGTRIVRLQGTSKKAEDGRKDDG